MPGPLTEEAIKLLAGALPKTRLDLTHLFSPFKQNLLSMYIHGALSSGMTRRQTKMLIRSQGISFTNHPFNILFSLLRRANKVRPFLNTLSGDDVIPMYYLSPATRSMQNNIYYYIENEYTDRVTEEVFTQRVTVGSNRPLSVNEAFNQAFSKVEFGYTIGQRYPFELRDVYLTNQRVIGGQVHASFRW